MRTRTHRDRPRPAALSLSPEQHTTLVTMLDAKTQPRPGRDVRQVPRYPYLLADGLAMVIHHPGGSWLRYHVQPRNLSREGIAFFHSGFLHPESYAVFHLPQRNGAVVVRHGRVIHCRYIFGRVHEVGAHFNDAIDVAPFIESTSDDVQTATDPAAPMQSELWDQPAMRPRVLDYLVTLDAQVVKLEALLRPGGDASPPFTPEQSEQIRAIARDIQSAATVHGYPGLSQAAASLLEAHLVTEEAGLAAPATELLAHCHAACRFPRTLGQADPLSAPG